MREVRCGRDILESWPPVTGQNGAGKAEQGSDDAHWGSWALSPAGSALASPERGSGISAPGQRLWGTVGFSPSPAGTEKGAILFLLSGVSGVLIVPQHQRSAVVSRRPPGRLAITCQGLWWLSRSAGSVAWKSAERGHRDKQRAAAHRQPPSQF